MPNPDLITTSDAAKILGVDVRTVNRMALDGRLPVAIKIPGLRGARLFEPAAVQAVASALASAA